MTDEQRVQFDLLLADLARALDRIDSDIDTANTYLQHEINPAIAEYNRAVDRAVYFCSHNGVDDQMILCRLDPEKTLQKMDAVRESLQRLRELTLTST